MFCGDSICQSCVTLNFKNMQYECAACGEVMKSKVLKDGRIVINDKYCRIRDAKGEILVKNQDDHNEILE